MADKRLRILLEMRPALDGHAGIPQETRLLFRGLRGIEDMQVEGLLQSSGQVLSRGLDSTRHSSPAKIHRDINRLSKVVVSLKEKLGNPHLAAVLMALKHIVGGQQRLTRFETRHFEDFIWRALFSRTLAVEDFNAVVSADFRIARVPWTAMHRCALASRMLGYPLYPRLDTTDFDVVIAETPYPGTVSPRTQMVVRYHDAIPVLMPHTISDKPYHQASHYQALLRNVRSGAWFSCVSDATRNDLLSIFPEVEGRSTTIHNMVSPHYFSEESSPRRIAEIISTRVNEKLAHQVKRAASGDGLEKAVEPEYLLMVSTIEPRKNHAALLAAWEQLRYERFPNLKLVIVGMLGWDHANIVKKFAPWLERNQIFVLEDVPSPELRLLYRHARATVCPSFGEGFDFSGVEAMRCGSAVIASDIPVHREIYGNAAEYFSAYSPADLAQAITNVISPETLNRRSELVQSGDVVSAKYLPDVILPKWREYLQAIQAKRA